MTRSIAHWLRALADCGVLRVTFDDDALIEAIDLGLVEAKPVAANEDALDCHLTAAGATALSMQISPERKAA